MSTTTNKNEDASNDGSQITHVLNRDKKYLSEHGQKLFNAINCLLDDQEQLELTQALFKYQREHNVFTLVRSCRELFDSSRKKSLMLFMRPVIPVRDRFHYDEYYKLFFPEEFSTDVKSIFTDLIPKDLLEKTLKKANDKKKLLMEKEIEKEQEERIKTIKLLEKANYDLNLDLQKFMSKVSISEEIETLKGEMSSSNSDFSTEKASVSNDTNTSNNTESINNDTENIEKNTAQVAGFRIIDLAPNENESLGFDICLGPTGTFIMISYVEPACLVEKMGMKIGDELVSVNEISFKMIDLEQAIEVLSTQPTLRIVLQKSGFMPEEAIKDNTVASENSNFLPAIDSNENSLFDYEFKNDWVNAFGKKSNSPAESKSTFKKYMRRIFLRPKITDDGLGFKIRGGIEYSLGVFISYVYPNSNADLLGLRVSDQIIEVNGQKFSRISKQEALLILKDNLLNYRNNFLPIKLTVRYLSKMPVLIKRSVNTKNTNMDSCVSNQIKQSDNKDILRVFHESKESFKTFFESNKEFLLFKYYLYEYLNNRINIQYFVYLILNKLKPNKKIFDQENLELFIKLHNEIDYKIFKQILDQRLFKNQETAKINLTSRILNDDFKNSLIVRSSEVLNDLNIHSVDNSNKYHSFTFEYLNSNEDLISSKKDMCKSLDNLIFK